MLNPGLMFYSSPLGPFLLLFSLVGLDKEGLCLIIIKIVINY